MKYVTCFGGVYRLSDANYKRALRQISQCGSCDLDQLGAKTVCVTAVDITDMTEEEAAELSDEIKT